MKKILVIGLVMMISAVAAFADRPIEPAALPAKAKAFIAEAFPKQVATYVEADWDEYEVVLDDGTEIKFTGNGEWDEVKSYHGVPSSILSNVIASQIETMFPDVAIIEIDKERGKFEIKMANRMKVYFSANGKLIGQRYDD